MKFLKLDLRAFGPFTDQCLDLSQPAQGLHLIYGPNEAGKSSTLRAITDFLFEIPGRSNDNFIHQYSKLRIGAELEGSEGQRLQIIRRKGNQKTLRCEDDQNPVDESLLQAFLGNIDRTLFELMFGIDHARLRQGGAQILAGEGEIGKLLFAAGAGVANLQDVQSTLTQETEQLLKPTGRSGYIAESANQLRDLQNSVKESQVPLESWKKHDEALQTARAQQGRCDQAIREKQSEFNRLSRIRNTIPIVGRWKQAQAEWEAVRQVPLLDQVFSETYRQTIIDFETARQQQANLAERHQQILAKLKLTVVPEQIIQEATAIETARNELGSYLKAKADLPRLTTARNLAENDVHELLQKLGRPPELSEIESLRLTSDKTILIQTLGTQKEGVVERERSTLRESERINLERSQIVEKLQSLQDLPDYRLLQQKLKLIQQQGDLEKLLQTSQSELRELEQEAEVRLQQLPLWKGAFAEIELLAVPSSTTVDQFAEEFREQERQLGSLQQNLQQQRQDQESIETRLEQLELGQSVPTDAELTEKRQLREQGWQLVLDAWQKNEEDAAAQAEFLDQFPGKDHLSKAYHQSVEHADQVADQLRSDADRVATKAQLLQQRERNLAGEATLLEEIAELQQRQQASEERWQELWTGLQINPRSPKEMSDWLRQQEACCVLSKEIRLKRSAIDEQIQTVATSRTELTTVLTETEPDLKCEQRSLKELLEIADERCQHYQKLENQREQYEEERDSLQKQLCDSLSQASQAQDELQTWKSNWEKAVQEIGLDAEALPAQANQVLADINDLMSKFQKVEQLRIRIDDIQREAEEFSLRTRELIQRIDPELESLPLSEAVNKLDGELKAARLTEEKQTGLLQQERELEHECEEARSSLSRLNTALTEMCRQAGCDNHKNLSQAVEQSQKRQQLEQTSRALQEQILLQSSGSVFEEFLAEVELEAKEADTLPPRMAELENDLNQLNQERDVLIGQIVSETSELAKIDGSAQAAEKAAECESVTARLEEQVHDYVVLKLASSLLNEGIDRYRQKNEGPVLKRASEIFCEITMNAYQGLKVDFDEKAQPVLAAVRNNDLIQVIQMSDGTCDQLYLALRLASLETWLEHHEPLPLIVDDILLNFDDERAVATLKVLSDLARQTQVLFFTHHAHLVKIAEENLSDENLHVTNLHELTFTG
ncbi:YhaN family protein [Gimesia maris]|uniref:Chromosome segregation protein n=1 Tax=Gimesia maris TaxID=122 RepID=A0ABX5YNI0_9PLAN|nr:YhaN family protein [Gimesia maris]EDL62307.1 hypothetical protein PM8797T_28304 [Gimesia maris DSM 8797]QEG17296.1 chromosome segregation protein [Gimesia maris]QGQ29607.1 AAA family ATPase [Gimesia maris]